MHSGGLPDKKIRTGRETEMRNIDEIKMLKAQLKAVAQDRNYQKKQAQKQHEEVEKYRMQLQKYEEGIQQIQQAADIVVTTCAVMFGEETETGYVLSLPRSMEQHNLQAFTLKMRNVSDGEMIFEVVERARAKAHGKGKAAEQEATPDEESAGSEAD